MNDFWTVKEHLTCCACEITNSQPGDEWGTDWTTDDHGFPYCSDCNHLNPTSDTYSTK